MDIDELLLRLQEKGARLRLDEDRLLCDFTKGALDKSLKQSLIENKEEIKAFIKKTTESVKAIEIATITPYSGQKDSFPLSFAQQRLWLIHQLDPENNHYNLSVAINLEGELDRIALQEAFHSIIHRHKILRTVYSDHERVPYQFVQESFQFVLDFEDISHFPEKDQFNLFEKIHHEKKQKPFDLTSDLMLQGMLLKQNVKKHILIVIIHHIACDGWSQGILINELGMNYSSIVKGEEKNFQNWKFNMLITLIGKDRFFKAKV